MPGIDIPFNRPHLVGTELGYIQEAVVRGHLSGNGWFTKQCHAVLESIFGGKVLLTQSATAALEMSAILAGLGPGDEVIMPSYTFTSTANAFVLRGAVPVFVDIRPDTLNVDEALIEGAITPRTRAILVVHYGGVGCEMLPIMRIAERHGLLVIEDAAHAFGGRYRDRPLGGIGHMAALSFHETKNVMAGEGGALIINDPRWIERAEIVWEKGTDRMRFARGEVSKYTWIDLGSSFLPSEIIAAVLWGQLEARAGIQAARWNVWRRYDAALRPLATDGVIQIPHIPEHCEANAHVYYVVLPSEQARDAMIADAARQGVQMVIHYVPLHLSQAGRRFGRAHGQLRVTEDLAARLLRLPLWIGLDAAATDRVLGCFPMLQRTA